MLRTLCLAVLLSSLAFLQDKKPEVHLNHAFIVPDAETYEAIRNSEFVKQFAVWEERTTHRKDITYTGFYLYGHHTYFEFLKPDERNPVGASKIGFGVDRTGELDLLQKRAEAAGIKTEIKTITRSFNGKDVDWFRSLEPKDESESPLSVWTLEYVPTFLALWNSIPGEKSAVRRENVLKRYVEVVKQRSEDKIMGDVKTVFLRLPASGIKEAVRACNALGLRSNRDERSGIRICKESETAVFIWQEQNPGISCIAFQLRDKLPNSDHSIGRTKLMIRGDVAYWDFHPELYSWESETIAGFPPPCHHR